jgi:hypothetical protein
MDLEKPQKSTANDTTLVIFAKSSQIIFSIPASPTYKTLISTPKQLPKIIIDHPNDERERADRVLRVCAASSPSM